MNLTFLILNLGLAIFLTAVVFLIKAAIIIGFIYGMPVTRRERAKSFIDLLETGIKDGHSPEHIVVELSQAREQSFGLRFHLLAAHIESGLRFGKALEKSPKVLPRKIRAMLRVGEETGLLRPMLVAARKTLNDATSQTLTTLNYLTPSLIFSFVIPYLFWVLSKIVFPKFITMMYAMKVPVPAFSEWVFNADGLFLALLCFPITFVVMRCVLLEDFFAKPLEDRLLLSLPWRRTRIQRNFAGTLALLLDVGVAEDKALTLAAEGTSNQFFIERVQTAVGDLRNGSKLTDVVHRLDSTGEFQWRMKNAAQGKAGFETALAGWVESLDAKAFQQEQTASTLLTTGLVLLNAFTVGLITIAIFQTLIAIVNQGVLW